MTHTISDLSRTAVIIPARIDSEEVHAKVLVDLCGKSVIERVYDGVAAVKGLDQIVIAADHERITRAAHEFGARTYRTRRGHVCGSDRVAEAARNLYPDADIVVNVQADEPFLHPEMIVQVIEPLLLDDDFDMATLCCRCDDQATREFPFTVKVVKAAHSSRALYFSRAVIPFPRYPKRAAYFQHIGIYAYRMRQLQRFAELGPCELELTEGLEQLRALEGDMRIKVVETELPYPRLSIDTQEDIEKARRWLASQEE